MDLNNSDKTFKSVFKFYKRKNVKLDVSNVIDFNQYGQNDKNCHFKDKVNKIQISNADIRIDWEAYNGMLDPQDWKVFSFTLRPGLIYIKNPFQSYGQRYWIARCLKDFTKKPNHLNIDAHNVLNEGDDWWDFCQREHDTDAGRETLEKLRWATLGYHHNWDTKEYSEELRNEFPEDLKFLCRVIANSLGFPDFNAEAAIINMYHKGSHLNGHTDHSEVNLSAPLFSFSFGQSAIFLLGGRTIDEEPIPLLLESGDIIVMSGEARLCYHGVPRILETCSERWNYGIRDEKMIENPIFERELLARIGDNCFWKPFNLYVSKSRINMNIRQVLFSGQTKLPQH